LPLAAEALPLNLHIAVGHAAESRAVFNPVPPGLTPAVVRGMAEWAALGAVLLATVRLARWRAARRRHLRETAPAIPPPQIPGAPLEAGSEFPATALIRESAAGAIVAGSAAAIYFGATGLVKFAEVDFATLAFGASVWTLVRIDRDRPAIGQPPVTDPKKTAPAAWKGVALAVFGIAMAVLKLYT
jgi:hypothetical protein